MIKYSLRCEHGHEFDQWFENMADYDGKAQQSGLACPDCGSHEVKKAIMAPRVGKTAPAPAPSCGNIGCGNMQCPMMAGM